MPHPLPTHSLHLQVHMTEIDVAVPLGVEWSAQQEQRQAEVYAALLQVLALCSPIHSQISSLPEMAELTFIISLDIIACH